MDPQPLPVEVLLGVYLGLLTGVFPALVAGGLGFVFRYFTGVSIPGFAVVVLAAAVAGVNGGLLGLVDPAIKNSPRLLSALVVVLMLSLWAHSQGDRLGGTLPRRFSLRQLRERTLSADVVDFVGGFGEVTIRADGPVEDLEGYPPLSADLRTALESGQWRFPADLPLRELETRLADRLSTEHDLADVVVSVDARGRATIAAAPPASGLSRRIPDGHRAVSVEALVPTGLSVGDEVRVVTADGAVEGTLLGARSDPTAGPPATAETPPSQEEGDPVPDGGEDVPIAPAPRAPTTDGGEGRVTVAVPRADATLLLNADRGVVYATSRGTRREYELVSLLRRAGRRIRKLSVGAESVLDGQTIGEAAVRDTYGVAILAVRVRPGDAADVRRWTFSPHGDVRLSAGDDLFVVGTRDALVSFAEVAT